MQDKNEPEGTTAQVALEQRELRLRVGVVIERRESVSRWRKWAWKPTSVFLGAGPEQPDWRLVEKGSDWTTFHCANLELVLHRKEAEDYRVNLSSDRPRVFVVLRASGLGVNYAYVPFFVTAAPYSAESYMHGSDEIVEGVAMPEPLIALVRAFTDRHHDMKPFVKRQRTKYFDRNETPFARPPGWRESDNGG